MKDIELQTEAFKRYIQECDELSITPDYASAFNAAWNARAAVEADRAQRVPDGKVLVGRGELNMVINALRRDAEQGRSVRGEMADYLLASTPAQPAQQEPHAPPKPTVVIDLGDHSPLTARIVWSDWVPEKNALTLCVALDGDPSTPTAFRMRDTGYRRPRYVYFTTKEEAEAEAERIFQSRDDGHLTDLTPLFGHRHAAQHQEQPQQERKPMTDREADILTEQHYYLGGRMPADYRISVVRATERHHGIFAEPAQDIKEQT